VSARKRESDRARGSEREGDGLYGSAFVKTGCLKENRAAARALSNTEFNTVHTATPYLIYFKNK
jgi:hypothetical protein